MSSSNRQATSHEISVDRHEDTSTRECKLSPCTYTPEVAPFVTAASKRTYPADFQKRMDNDGDEGRGGEFYPGSGDQDGDASLGAP